MMTQAWHPETYLNHMEQERKAAATASRQRRQARLARRTSGRR